MLYLPLFVVLLLVGGSVCADSISLVVPDFDPQPLSAEVIGVGANGETTYLLFPGQPTGTWIGQPAAFTGTATLVEDASNVVFEYANSALSITVAESCAVGSGIANCLVGLNGVTTATAQDTVTPLLIQGGGTVTGTFTSLQPTSSTVVTVPAPGSSVPGSSATQSSTSPSASATKATSSGERVRPAIGIVGVVGMLAISAVVA